MIVLRSKSYADLPSNDNNNPLQPTPQQEENPLTSKEMMIEQMRQQRQLMQTQRLRQRLQAQETRDKLRAIRAAQKMEKEEKSEDDKNNIKIKRLENQDNSSMAKNVSLYKTKSKLVAPVPMK
jgi:coproporphyrinogen III oxidase-like Fe-S oxidoreductase